MKKIYFFIIIIFLLSGCSQKKAGISVEDLKTVKINGREIKVEIADTPELQFKGLSGRKNICANCGMLFVFNDRKKRTFVMRDMNFPLDIIFIDGDPPAGEAGKIVKIYKNLPPEGAEPRELYNSGKPVNFVLEVNGGFAESYSIKEGDKINYD